jgi:Sulfotransferase domain
LPNFRSDNAPNKVQDAEALLNPQSHALRSKLRSKRRELPRVRQEIDASTNNAERLERNKRKKTLEQEIFRLENEIRAVEEGVELVQDGRVGALPDFVIIGAKKCGTTFLYDLLSQHPLVQPAASKEPHFFDKYFDEGTEWYRRFFPAPRWEDGRRTMTGEATPYIINRRAPERMAELVPQARLIALLRDPVDRAYSDYQMLARKERELSTFEEAIEAEGTPPLGTGGNTSVHEDGLGLDDGSKYISRGVYVDQLRRWSRFFPREQLLVLKSEDFFEDPKQTLKRVLQFLGLPEWEPEPSKLETKRNTGRYEGEMVPATRRRLENYFEPHNRRLYEYLGVDLGW